MRDFTVARLTRHNDHPATSALDERRVVRSLATGCVCSAERSCAKRLRGLYGNEGGTVRRIDHCAVGCDHLDRVGHRNPGHRTVGTTTHGIDDCRKELMRGKGPSGIVHTHDFRVCRYGSESVAHRLAAGRPAGHLVLRCRIDLCSGEHEDDTVGCIAGDGESPVEDTAAAQLLELLWPPEPLP